VTVSSGVKVLVAVVVPVVFVVPVVVSAGEVVVSVVPVVVPVVSGVPVVPVVLVVVSVVVVPAVVLVAPVVLLRALSPPPSSCSAKAMVTTDSTLKSAIAATMLTIDPLRLILLPFVARFMLCLWLATLQVRVLFSHPLLTLAHSSVTIGVRPCICRMAISWKAPRESMAGKTRKLFRTSQPSTQQL
jgi:hypothetical protein